MAQEYQYFYEDEVYRFNKKGNLELGMVLENAEFVSSDEESDVDEEDKVTKGSIRVAWYPKGEEQVLPERKVGLADRSLMPGDVVRRLIRGKDTQRGYCRQVHVTSSVQVVGTKHVILNVDSNDLTPLEEFTTDIAVALDSWVGMVHMVKCRLVMLCADGSRCIMSDGEALELDDMRDTRDRVRLDSEFRRYDFYPGQQLVGCSRAFEDVEWIHRTREMEVALSKPHKSIKVSVEQVQVVQLGVRWQCRAFSNDSNVDKEQPKYLVQGEDLKRVKMLNVFEPCTLQLGDRNYYSSKEGDVIMTREQWRKLMAVQLSADHTNPCPLRPRPAKNKSKRKVRSVLADAVKVTTESNTAVCKEVRGAEGGVPRENSKDDDTADSDGYIDLDTDDCSDTASISSGASTGSLGKRNKKGPALMTRMMKKCKLKRAKRRSSNERTIIKPGDKLVVETLMTTSKADVVWQDGTLEKSILSTVLYPIHHLDDQEFFPGDFVVEQKDSIDPHEYGVVQKVDHGGRTSIVKWFRTYTAGSEPRPQFLCEQEMSVYDLRDHPDFRYRPGSVVIRVANFENDQTCFTGQVLDNFPSGEVSVWWVDGRKSVCYPQDLYKVGEYDSDEGELWDDTASDESWETESEHSVIAEESESESEGLLKTRLVANIEKARIAMSRLEEIFTQNPALQTTAVMKQLLDCYKECRYMDKLMGTSFFHESNFQGLIEKVRERGRASTTQRMTEQINRLFSTSDTEAGPLNSPVNCGEESKPDAGKSDALKLDIAKSNKGNPSNKDIKNSKECGGCCNADSDILSSKNAILSSSATLSENLANLSLSQCKASKSDKLLDGGRSRGGELRHKRMSETDMTLHDKTYSDSRLKDSKSCNDLKVSSETLSGVTEEIRTSHMCAQLCSLMKAQLLKTYEEVVFRFGGHFDMSLMQACQDTEGAHGENKENLQSENKENIPIFIAEDLVNENTTTESLAQGIQQFVKPTTEALVLEKEEKKENKEDENDLKNDFEDASELSPSYISPAVTSSPTTNGSIITNNGNDSEISNRNVSSEDSRNDELVDAILASLVEAVNGEVTAAATETCGPEIAISPTEGCGQALGNCLPSSEPDGFLVLEAAPDSHKFKLTMFQPTDPPHFYRTVRKEMKLLKTSLPPGIWVRGYEDRMDLYSVMIRGPERTPYEDGLFFFDFQLSADYPRAPPLCHYVTYCSDKLNPNLYEDGKVCVSLLGTWSGKGTEVWTSQSNLLQVIISIQGLILVSEPYFNEAGYERQKGTQQGRENSRMYNEMVVLKLIQAMAKVIQAPPDIFKNEIIHHFHVKAFRQVQRLECWLEISENYNICHPLSPTTPTTFREIHNPGTPWGVHEIHTRQYDTKVDLPEFPLIPASKGFCITLRKTLQQFKGILDSVGVSTDHQAPPGLSIADGKRPTTSVNTPNSEVKATKVPSVETETENIVGRNS
ncbi:(E3-independent) E2 ubiquitin-conjugating enzyme UBE2O-like isoform X3 [Homarus americanus]|uniref:(E3-independent) E2 ubiquitin-conjugating enzyme UBE2O-like isoform X3 n=1 Tax=Homarus americanus TaxID=6706 RepID=UPI001C460D68|nr:(E3-independent) E2 ubiquitin-conjugating enzyme UBE2O-like isoform X3 [Homarus americanus]